MLRAPSLATTDINTVPIVSDLEKFEATIFYHYFDGRRASIHGIFNKLLEGMHGCYYDLACSNLVYHILVKSLPAVVSFYRQIELCKRRTLILLGASGERSGPSAFLFVPLGTPASISIISCSSP